MLVGIPTEIKNNEYRVAITPAGVAELTKRGHDVIIQAGAGAGSAITDNDFKAAGAQIVESAERSGPMRICSSRSKNPSKPSTRGCDRAKRCSPTCIWPRPGRAPMR